MSVHGPGLNRSLSSGSRHSYSHSRQSSLISPTARHSRFSFNENSSEVLEAKAHPGGLLRGIAARRAFNDIIWPMQAQSRRFLARRRFEDMLAATAPQRQGELETRVVALAGELRGHDDELETLRNAVAEAAARELTARRRCEDKLAGVARLEGQLRALQGPEVAEVDVRVLRDRLDEIARQDSERDAQIGRLLAQLADVERRSYAASTGTAAVSRALQDAKGRMEQRLLQHRPSPASMPADENTPPSKWTVLASPTLRKLDRTTHSPRAPPPNAAKVGLTLQIPDSDARTDLSSSAMPLPHKRSESVRVPRSAGDTGLLSARRSRFSMPPQPASASATTAPSIRVTIVRPREAAPPPKPAVELQSRLEAFYRPSPTVRSLGALSEEDEDEKEKEKPVEKEQDAAALPAYAAELLAELSKSDLEDAQSLRVGNSRILSTIDQAKKERRAHSRKESRPGLFKVFGLR